jgi:hypothetical protein
MRSLYLNPEEWLKHSEEQYITFSVIDEERKLGFTSDGNLDVRATIKVRHTFVQTVFHFMGLNPRLYKAYRTAHESEPYRQGVDRINRLRQVVKSVLGVYQMRVSQNGPPTDGPHVSPVRVSTYFSEVTRYEDHVKWPKERDPNEER